MQTFKRLETYSLGMGDRFGHQGRAQLQAVIQARAEGIHVTPVWNKSNREHTLIGTEPASVRAEAEAAVRALQWTGAFHVDADHINLDTVDGFLEASDFFTIDVAACTGKPAAPDAIQAFVANAGRLAGRLAVPGLPEALVLDEAAIRAAASKYLLAASEAGRIYRHIAAGKGAAQFVTEVSMDETDAPQTPAELLLILAMLAAENVPAQTIAPKFTGRFNKGVDYAGDLASFAREFEADLCVVAFAVREFGFPPTLKLSVHSGSDKFSLYPIINRLIKKHQAGLHLKTAGTTWLEEVIGLAESGGEGLAIARDLYAGALDHFDELTAPYATVIDIDRSQLPDPGTVRSWDGATYANTLRHVPSHPAFNPHFRQLIHVAFKLAARMGERYTGALTAHEAVIARNVTTNLHDRHLLPVFG